MQFRPTFNKKGGASQLSPHPKRQVQQKVRTMGANRVPLTQNSFINLQPLLVGPKSRCNKSSQHPIDCYPLAQHLLGANQLRELWSESQQENEGYGGMLSNRTYKETESKRQKTLQDEDSQYLNYMKEYTTVVKNSRHQEFVSPEAHKKQIEGLITQFLSDMQDQDSKKSSRKSQKSLVTNVKNERKVREQRSNSTIPDSSVKIQKIDLTSMNSTNNKSYRKQVKNVQTMINKKRQRVIAAKQGKQEAKKQSISPRFGKVNDKSLQEGQKNQIKKKMKNYSSTSNSSMSVELIGVADMREKAVRNVKPVQKNQSKNTSWEIPNGYASMKREIPKNSYLQQNLQKVGKIQQKNNNSYFINGTGNHEDKKQSKQVQQVSKKPIKIEIEIPLQQFEDSDDQNIQKYLVQSSMKLQHDEAEIIKDISQRVVTLLKKSPMITPKKGK